MRRIMSAAVLLVGFAACSVVNDPAEGGAGGAATTGAGAGANGSGGAGGTLSCEGGEKACGDRCIDATSDPDHCGGCGQKCGSGQSCEDSKCVCTDESKSVCGAACVDLDSDLAHCGACGNACATPTNVTATCADGVCAYQCTENHVDCNEAADDGCEVDVTSDPKHCGECDAACSAVANGSAGCQNGICGIGACDPGFGDCDGDATNGCELDVQWSNDHCGACGNACGANRMCFDGTCIDGALSCKAIKDAHPAAKDGVYLLDVDGPNGPKAPYMAYCEMTTDGGGWEVMAYLRSPSHWDWSLFANQGVVGDTAGGFATGGTMSDRNGQFKEKIIIYLKLIELGNDLGKQWMVNHRDAPVSYSTVNVSSGWAYRDSFNYQSGSVSNVCTHGCSTFRVFGMFHDGNGFGYCGTQGGNSGCRDGNNICWQPRSLGCNVGSQRCAYLVNQGEGVIYAVR